MTIGNKHIFPFKKMFTVFYVSGPKLFEIVDSFVTIKSVIKGWLQDLCIEPWRIVSNVNLKKKIK